MKMRFRTVVALSALIIYSSAIAGTASISAAGAKNMGSTIAYVFYCEKSGHLAVGTTPKLLFAARDSFTPDAYQMVNSQYQESLHEKKIYSISKDKWFPFKVDSKSCEGIGEVIPTMISSLEQANR